MLLRPIPNGFLVAVEGIDGAGKTTLASQLAQRCGECGLAALFSKEPTGNAYGRELRASAKAGRLTLERELELFHLDRRDHVTHSIRPALEESSIVILDRYFYSTAAYQGARGADVAEVLQENLSFAPAPDLLLLMDLEVKIGLERIRKRGDKPNLFENEQALSKAREIFLQLAKTSGVHAVIVDASQSPSAVQKQVFQAFQTAALNKMAAAGVASKAVDEFLAP